MTDANYLKEMIMLNKELEQICQTEPFDSAAWDKALLQMHKTNFYWYHRRRQGFNWSLAACLFLACVLSVLFLLILFELLPYGSSPVP